jgi:hypothetical protein
MRGTLIVCLSLLGGTAPSLAETLPLRCTFDNQARMNYTVDLDAKTVRLLEPTNNAEHKFVDGNGGVRDVSSATREYVVIDDQTIRFGMTQCSSRVWALRLKCDDKVIQATSIDRTHGTIVLEDENGQKIHGQCEKDDAKPKF